MGASSNTLPAETQLQRRHHLAHRDAANAATGNMALDAQLKIVRRTESSTNEKAHAFGCKYSRIKVDYRQLTI